MSMENNNNNNSGSLMGFQLNHVREYVEPVKFYE